MAVGSAPQSQYDAFINDKLEQAQSRVRLVELSTGLLLVVGFVLAYLLAFALIDHWLLPLGVAGRLGALLGLLAGTAYLIYIRVWPPLMNPIEPAFAARAIEQSQPTLKNSVLNYWFLRSTEARVHRAVLQAVEKRAANDLTQVSVDLVVDRRQVFRLAVLVGIIFLCVPVYAYFSPKNPFQTAARVALPFAGIDQPTRVSISEVSPTDANIPFGTTVTVSAEVTGLRDTEKPVLAVTREDGHVVRLAMAPAESSSESKPGAQSKHDANWQVMLTEEWLNGSIAKPNSASKADDIIAYDPTAISPESAQGLRRPVAFQVFAGDASSQKYEIKIGLSPTVALLNVRYEYPPYTGRLPENSSEELLSALENTKVKLQIEANYPLQSAELQLDRSGAAADAPPKRIRMNVKGANATGELWLKLDGNRRDPEFTHYQVRVVTEAGFKNKNPVRHRIRVIGDLEPEVSRQNPVAEKEAVELLANRTLPIVFRARDPDYALTDVRVHVARNGQEILMSQNGVTRQASVGEALLQPGKTESGQFIGKWTLNPRALKLQPGDQVLVWATAEDNRQVPAWKPEPNRARSTNLVVKILEPPARDPNSKSNPPRDSQKDPNQEQQPPSGENSGDPQDQNAGERQNNPDSQEGSDPSNSEANDSEQENSEDATEGDSGQDGSEGSQSSDSSETGESGESTEGEDGSQASGESGGSGTGSDGESQSGEADSGMDPQELSSGGSNQENSGDEATEGGSQEGGEGSAGSSTNSSGGDSGSSAGGENSNPSDSSSSGEPSAGDSLNGTPNPDSTQQSGDNAAKPRGESGGDSGAADPTEGEAGEGREEPLHDGEIIEKINEYRRQKGLETADQPNGDPNSPQNPESAGESGTPKNSGKSEQSGSPPAKGTAGEEGTPAEGTAEEAAGNGQNETADESGNEGSPSAENPETGKPDGQEQSAGDSASGTSQPEKSPNGDSTSSPDGSTSESGDAGSENSGPTDLQNADSPQSNPSNSAAGDSGSPPDQPENAGETPQPKPGDSTDPATAGEQNPDASKGNEDSAAGEATDTQENASQPQPSETDSGSGLGDPGESGAGNSADQPEGSGQSQGENQDSQKSQQGGEEGEGNDPGSPSNSDKQSDSQGGEGGDRSGGGDQGAGQSSGQEGNDSPGSSSPGDSGSGAAEESGSGETGSQPGDKEPGGSAGNQPQRGDGGRSGEQPGNESGGNPSNQGSGPNGSDSSGDSSQSSGEQVSGDSNGGGGAGRRGAGNEEGEGAAGSPLPPEERKKIEYAKKATDLALETLKNEPDQELLDELGMTPAELEAWKQRVSGWKDQSSDQVGKQKYEENLRSLGLRPNSGKGRGQDVVNDKIKGIRQTGIQSKPPPGYAEGMRAFKKRSGQ